MTARIHPGLPIDPAVIAVAVVVICATVMVCYLLPPWSRKWPTPRRQIDDMRDYRKMVRMKRRWRKSLAAYPTPKPPKAAPGQEGDA